MKQNELLLLLGKDAPGTILGVVMGKDMTNPACIVRFGDDADIKQCAEWLKPKFVQWSGRKEQILTVTINPVDKTVEIKG